MKRLFSLVALVVVSFVGVNAYAQSGHFVGSVSCKDIGTQVQCTGKVAGLGSTGTFTVLVEAQGTASVECTNPAGNVAPGQSFTTTAAGSETQPTPNNGQARFNVSTGEPTIPAGACPNNKWTASVVDVTFTTATVTLLEGTTQSDQQVVTVAP